MAENDYVEQRGGVANGAPERWSSTAHVPLLLASCAPCDGPDGLPTGNGSAGTTVAESASAAATMAADFIRRFSPYYLRRRLWRTLPSQPRADRASEIAALGCISSLPEWGNFIRAISGQLVCPENEKRLREIIRARAGPDNFPAVGVFRALGHSAMHIGRCRSPARLWPRAQQPPAVAGVCSILSVRSTGGIGR